MIIIINTFLIIFFVTIIVIFVTYNIRVDKDIYFLLKETKIKDDDVDTSISIMENKIKTATNEVIDLLYNKSYEDIQQTLSLRDSENKNIFSYTVILTALFSVFYIFTKITFNSVYKDLFIQLLFCLSFSSFSLIISTAAYFKALSFQYELPRDTASLIDCDIKTIKANTIAVNAVGAQNNQEANRNKIHACKIAKKYIKICLLFYFVFGLTIFLYRFFSTFNN